MSSLLATRPFYAQKKNLQYQWLNDPHIESGHSGSAERNLCSCSVGLDLLHGFVTVYFLRDGIVSPTLNPQLGGPRTTLRLALSFGLSSMDGLPGAYVPASIALRATEAGKPLLHDKAVALEKYSIV
jgi:hypothetical protein